MLIHFWGATNVQLSLTGSIRFQAPQPAMCTFAATTAVKMHVNNVVLTTVLHWRRVQMLLPKHFKVKHSLSFVTLDNTMWRALPSAQVLSHPKL